MRLVATVSLIEALLSLLGSTYMTVLCAIGGPSDRQRELRSILCSLGFADLLASVSWIITQCVGIRHIGTDVSPHPLHVAAEATGVLGFAAMSYWSAFLAWALHSALLLRRPPPHVGLTQFAVGWTVALIPTLLLLLPDMMPVPPLVVRTLSKAGFLVTFLVVPLLTSSSGLVVWLRIRWRVRALRRCASATATGAAPTALRTVSGRSVRAHATTRICASGRQSFSCRHRSCHHRSCRRHSCSCCHRSYRTATRSWLPLCHHLLSTGWPAGRHRVRPTRRTLAVLRARLCGVRASGPSCATLRARASRQRQRDLPASAGSPLSCHAAQHATAPQTWSSHRKVPFLSHAPNAYRTQRLPRPRQESNVLVALRVICNSLQGAANALVFAHHARQQGSVSRGIVRLSRPTSGWRWDSPRSSAGSVDIDQAQADSEEAAMEAEAERVTASLRGSMRLSLGSAPSLGSVRSA